MTQIEKQVKLWNKLKKELKHLDDNNYKARIIFDYITKHYNL